MQPVRIILPPEHGPACYHVVSRCVDRAFKLGTEDKERFIKAMRLQAAFSGVRVLTFCILDNHFHLLLEVPPRPDVRPDADALFARLAFVCSRETIAAFRDQYDSLLKDTGRQADAEAYLQRIWDRTHDLSKFMQELKARYTVSYNRRHSRVGTLWESRFHSTVVETGEALSRMATYIDLNPVRAGIVTRPEDYRWCGFTEAVCKVKESVAGLRRVMELACGAEVKRPVAAYRALAYGLGYEVRDERGRLVRRGFSEEEIQRVENREGEYTLPEAMKLQARWLTRSLVVGGKDFVANVYAAVRERAGWKREKRKAPVIQGLCVLGRG